MNIKVRHLVSALSLRSFGVSTMMQIIEVAKRIGFDGVQALPLRNTSGNEEGILYYEGYWREMPRGLLLDSRKGSPREFMDDVLASVLFAPFKEGVRAMEQMDKRGIHRISHTFDDIHGLVEINHNMGPNCLSKVAAQCLYNGCDLVVDTRHLLEKHPAGSFLPNDVSGCLDIIEELSDNLGSVFHLQPDQDMAEFRLNPESTPTGKLTIATLRILKRNAEELVIYSNKPCIDVVCEYNPGLKGLVSRTYSEALGREMLAASRKLVQVAGLQ